MAKLSEIEVRITAIAEKLDEAQTEIVAKIEELRIALDDVDLPEGAAAALDALDVKASALADIVPGTPSVTPV